MQGATILIVMHGALQKKITTRNKVQTAARQRWTHSNKAPKHRQQKNKNKKNHRDNYFILVQHNILYFINLVGSYEV
jgi:hypothetical protein